MEEAPWGTFQDELDWCIQKLETGLLTGPSPEQAQDKRRVLSVLQSRGSSFVQKRRVMQSVFGDYRQRMTEEYKTQDGSEGVPAEVAAETPPQAPGADVASLDPHLLQGQSSGFAFNFPVPASEPAETEQSTAEQGPDPGEGNSGNAQQKDQDPEAPPSQSKKKKKASRKKPHAEKSKSQQKQPPASQEAEPRNTGELAALSPEQQLARELDWCVEQLELGLRTQKSTPKQVEEANRALKTLRSDKAPLVKKRQVMRAMLGDYRKKMEDEKAKQVKLMQTALKSARVTAVSAPPKKAVFQRRAEPQTQAGPQEPGPQSKEDQRFVFTPAQEEFHFNFF
ncbi:UPF0488 protein C8orf33 homolog isoform X2 [Lepisosteus oculatus]|uniref:UPF0488 protein C8orf33 homolog isoform X2 n=1 Tax=Lepisosteus oculatus TaxID=7918 RepID=UPI0035F52C41